MKQLKNRKVLRISDGEFLMAIHSNRVETTTNVALALDITTLPFKDLYDVTNNLQKAGYKKMKVIDVK